MGKVESVAVFIFIFLFGWLLDLVISSINVTSNSVMVFFGGIIMLVGIGGVIWSLTRK